MLPERPPLRDSPTNSNAQIRRLKQGLKTGLAGLLAFALYSTFQLREGYWAVFTALVVTQSNLGASWQAGLFRTMGTAIGAISTALLASLIGVGPIQTALLLFGLTTLFAYLTARHAAFSAAGFTTALVLFFSHQQQPWELAWLRVLYTITGAVIAFAVGVLVWPTRARQAIRKDLSLMLEGCADLTQLVITNALVEEVTAGAFETVGQLLLQRRRAITQGLEEARHEPARSRFDHDSYVSFIEELDHIRQRLLAMAADRVAYEQAGAQFDLVPLLVELGHTVAGTQRSLAAAAGTPDVSTRLAALGQQLHCLDAALAALRKQRATAELSLDRMLTFWSLVFNLKELAHAVQNIAGKISQLQ